MNRKSIKSAGVMSIIDAIKGTPCLSLRQEASLLFALHQATLVIKGLRD